MISICFGGSARELNLGTLSSDVFNEFRSNFDPDKFIFSFERNSDFLIAVNHNASLYRDFINSGGSVDRAILLRLEPDSVFPAQYKNRVTSKYGLVISPGSTIQFKNAESQIGWPYQYHLNPAKPSNADPFLLDILKVKNRREIFTYDSWQRRTHLLTMISSNKVSPISSANYSRRRKLAVDLSSEILGVYGPLWMGSSYEKFYHRVAVLYAAIKQRTIPNLIQIYGNFFRTYKSARGTVDDKHKLIQESKFSLVVENSNSIVTEKIFDSIINGSIPIYVGPNLNLVGLPEDLVINVDGSASEVLRVLRDLNNKKELIEKRLVYISEFIQSDLFMNNWEATSVYRKIALQVIEYCIKKGKT